MVDEPRVAATVMGLVGRVSGGWTLLVLWPAIVFGAPFLGVPMLGCGAFLAAPGVALLWVAASVIPADYRLPLGRRVAGGVSIASGAVVLMVALLWGLGETHRLTLAWLRGSPLEASLELGGVAVAVGFAGLAYTGGFALRWGLHPLVALVAGVAAAALVPATCAVLVALGVLGIPLSA